MESSSLRILMSAGAALVGGAGVGWWIRGRYQWSRSVMLDELWTRKIRSYEKATEEAMQARTRDQTARGAVEQKLLDEGQRYAELNTQCEAGERQIEGLRGALATQHERTEKIELYAVQLDAELKTARQRMAEDTARIADQQKRLKRLRAYPPRLEECEAELARISEHAAQTQAEREAEITRLSDWIAELTPLTETLRRRDEEFALQARHFSEDREKSEARRERHEARLDEAQAELREWQDQARKLEHELQTARSQAAGAAQAREALELELRGAEQQLEPLQQRLVICERERDLQRQEAIRLSLKITELGVQWRASERAAAHGLLMARGSAKKTVPSREQTTVRAPSMDKPEPQAEPESRAKPKPKSKTKPRSATALAIKHDDLGRIKGIGPKVVERLARADIRTFAQLAQLGQQDLSQLALEVGVPAKRIEREGWLQSATELAGPAPQAPKQAPKKAPKARPR